VTEDSNTQREHIAHLNVHIKIAEEWAMKNYDSAEEFGKIDDLMIEAGRMFDEWGIGMNQTLDMDTMIDALSFVQTNREVYFQ
jgi:hypothetical protein